jgi:hypothetical protein
VKRPLYFDHCSTTAAFLKGVRILPPRRTGGSVVPSVHSYPHALRALEDLERTLYATGMDRVREVRRALVPTSTSDAHASWTIACMDGRRQSAR